ncbi:hypothetical protein RE428_36340 [Marinobacter nanhaiticus D15-8W]|uniref:Uncharacterized protein n=1 Tax=Marinobacter nanhaiticus D15-8W TaxID=626887 RepID=N6WZ28_9GAMM|nr:hypothetical protein [Marinobacter nanhaiticus]ENO16801.1 hypothetical protein J057_03815 [Marinobacter nanhaiticus D15-8W]BES72616.1 hypothetical protein RE428_36340 [Marinobacter nanhaiticus D15-8W]
MTRPTLFAVCSLSLLLTACGDGEQKDSPVDGRDTDGLYEPSVENYSGRVIDGYLRNARVWLDLDGDYQYDAADVEVVVGVNPERTITLADGEPTAMSGDGGRFSLDLSSFEVNPTLAADLDPTDYPLVAIVIPGVTEEETHDGYVTLEHAYQMSAPPGEQYVTPLATMVDARRVLGIGAVNVSSGLGEMLGNINVLGDYIRAGDEKAHAYARALARFLADQFPDEFENTVVANEGKVGVFSSEASRILRLSLSGHVGMVLGTVDAALGPGGRYENIDIGSLDIPQVPLDLENPILLHKVLVRASVDGSPVSLNTLDSNQSNVAELTYHYSEAGILQSIEANGCMNPSLLEIARLANVGGKVRDLNVQGLEGFYLRHGDSRAQYVPDDPESVDEKLTFNWAEQKAEFRTTTGCHDLAPSSEMPVEPQVTYSWTYGADGQVQAIGSSGGGSLSPSYDTRSRDPIFSYETENLGGQELILQEQPDECVGDITAENMEKFRVVSAQQDYVFSRDRGAMNDPPVPSDGAVNLTLDWDTRDNVTRLLRRVLYDHVLSTGSLLQWDYLPVTSEAFSDEAQPNLVMQARLALYDTDDAWSCGDVRGTIAASNLLADLSYQYIRLSDYIAENQDHDE